MAKTSSKLDFPIEGLNRNWAVSDQPALSSPSLQNVRAYDILGKRARGGQRPGQRKLYAQQIGGDFARVDVLLPVQIPSLIGGGRIAGSLVPPEPDPMTFSADFFAGGAYSAGTIALVNADATVTLTSGVWPAWTASDGVLVVNSVEYPIASRTDDTHIELATAWAGTSSPTASYELWHNGEPIALDTQSISMVATTATGEGGVEYYFANVTDPTHDSGWQDSPIFVDTGLAENTAYTYKVKARDKSVFLNETAYSDEFSATTLATPGPEADTTPPTYTPSAHGMWEVPPYVDYDGSLWYRHKMTAVTATDADSPPVQYRFRVISGIGSGSGWQSSPSYVAGPFTSANHTIYVVDIRDSAVPPNVITSSMWNTLYGEV